MDKLSIFSKRLRETRIKKGMTQKQLADKVGATAATISAYESADENKRKSPTLEKLVQISEVLEVSLDWLCDNHKGETKKQNNESNRRDFPLSDLVAPLVPLIRCGVCTVSQQEREEYQYNPFTESSEACIVHAALLEFRDENIEKVLTGIAKLTELLKGDYLTNYTYEMSVQGILQKSTDITIDLEKGIVNYYESPFFPSDDDLPF